MEPSTTSINPWAKPARLSSFAIFSSGYLFLRIIWSISWPILIPLLFKFGLAILGKILLGALAVLLICGLLGYLYYWRFKFWIENDTLIVERWFFKLTRLSVPLERIQSVAIEQSVWKQLLDVAELKVDSAGSVIAEVKLDAVDIAMAKSLKAYLESFSIEDNGDLTVSDIKKPKVATERVTLLKLSPFDLFKLGITENHLRSSLYILIAANWINQSISSSGFYQLIEDWISGFSFISDTATTIIILLLLWLIIAVLVSMFGAIFRYWNFKLDNHGDMLFATFGLTNKQERIIRNNRIQLIQERTNPLRMLIGLVDIKYKQAGTSRQLGGGLVIPGAPKATSYNLVAKFMGANEPIQLELKPANCIGYLVFGFAGISVFATAVLLYYFHQPISLTVMAFLLIVLPAWWYVKSYKTAFTNNGIIKQRAFYERKRAYTRWEKIQMVSISQTFWGRWFRIGKLTIFTAGGPIVISWLPMEVGRQLRDFCLYRLESENKAWM